MKIIWTNPALSDLIAIQDYIAQENPSAAYDVACRIKNAISQLSQFPEMGREGRVSNTRELIISNTPYIAPYEIDHDRLYVLAIFHASQKWPERF